jgi:hypothetical protein
VLGSASPFLFGAWLRCGAELEATEGLKLELSEECNAHV